MVLKKVSTIILFFQLLKQQFLVVMFFHCHFWSFSQSFSFRKIDQNTGLSELTTAYLSVDSNNFIWIGTNDGLNRFDGKNIKVYHPILPNGQPDPNLSSKVFEDRFGNKWFTTANSVQYLDKKTGKLKSYQLPNENRSNAGSTYHAFHLDKKNKLWVSANGSLVHFDVLTHKDSVLFPLNSYWCYAVQDSLNQEKFLINPLLEERAGVQILDNKGVSEKYFIKNDPKGFPAAYILFLFIENDSTIWMPSNIGLIKFNPYKPYNYKIILPENHESSPNFSDAKIWGEKYLWVSSRDKGLFLFELQNEQFIRNDSVSSSPDGFFSFPEVDNLFVTKNSLWLSTWGKGVLFTNFSNKSFNQLFFKKKAQISDTKRPVNFLSFNKEGSLFATIQNEGVFFSNLKEGFFEQYFPVKKIFLDNRDPYYHFSDSDGDHWILSPSTLVVNRKKSGGLSLVKNNFKGLSKIEEVSPNELLIMDFSGVHYFEKGNSFRKNQIIDFEDGYFFYLDSKKRIYLSDGRDKLHIYQYKSQSAQFIKTIDYVGYINSLVEDKDRESLWFASNKGLLKISSFNLENQFIIDPENKLQRSINCILQDDEGRLWLSSNNGILNYNIITKKVRHFTESDGLVSNQFRLRSCCKGPYGKLYFGSNNGATYFSPKEIRDNPNEPLLHITSIVINDKEELENVNFINLKKKTFTYDKRTVSFYFTGIEYSAPKENKYKYYLEGYDQDTVYAGTNGFARYANLPAGKYSFNIWGANSDDVWTKKPKTFELTILPPWYQTWWFKIITICTILFLLYSAYRFRIRQIQRKEAFKRKEAEFRQKEAEYKQLVAETETAVLRLQMNPHFIFNGMNSISRYILQKDINTANDYLVRFSKLMRTILKFAEKPFVSVNQEIHLLKDYLDTEAMRVGDHLRYSIEVDENIDQDEVILPTMILQPFVENAVWHGLSKKKSGGLIQVRFNLEKEYIICSIEDNGIGRIASFKQKPRLENHESKAISITQKRLQLLEKKYNCSSSLKIEDLFDLHRKPLGTKVELKIPLI